MEASSELHSEENKVSLEKSIKRRYKTPAQVMALEKFYNEHKYPTEEMKLQVAQQIGLTEKQVSGWFCHRRLKEKRLSDEAFAGGRQDRSSGVIQDPGSALRQDSCGSTKQADYRSIDPREVQSRMLYGHDYPAADLTYDRSQYTVHASGRDDTSSESSSFLQDRLSSRTDDPYAMETSRFQSQNGHITPLHRSSNKSTEYKPSGYLKVKSETENAAIIAVKRQLGRHYREDGPPLGIEFDQLPPGAFEPPAGDAVNEPFSVGSSGWSDSRDVPVIENPHALRTRYEVDISNMVPPYLSVHENLKSKREFVYPGTKFHNQLKQRSPLLHNSNLSPNQNSTLNIYENSAGETPVYDGKQCYRLSSKHDTELIGLDSMLDHRDPYGSKIGSEGKKPLLHDNHFAGSNFVRDSMYLFKLSKFTLGMGTKDRGQPKRMKKVKKSYREKKTTKGHHQPAGVRLNPTNEMTVAKRLKGELPQQAFMAKSSYAEIPRWTNEIKGSSMEIPSSFSEDETAETSSSMD